MGGVLMGFYKPSAQQLALACGVGGAYVDMTDYLLTDRITGAWGRTDGFSDSRPGVLSFDLVNDNGDLTPGNTASSLATKIRIGMGVHHIVDGMHFGGTIRSVEPYFVGPAGEKGSSLVRVTCDDMLGKAARQDIAPLIDGLNSAATTFWMFELDEDASSVAASGSNGATLTLAINRNGSAFGSAGIPGVADSTLNMRGNVAVGFDNLLGALPGSSFDYGTASMGFYSFWVADVSNAGVSVSVQHAGLDQPFTFGYANGQFVVSAGTGSPGTASPSNSGPFVISMGIGTTFAAGAWTLTATLYVNGSSVATSVYVGAPPSYLPVTSLTNAQRQPVAVTVIGGDAASGTRSANIARLSHTLTLPAEQLAIVNTEAGVLTALAAVSVGVTFDTLPAALSNAPLGYVDYSGPVLDAINKVIRTEQGSVWVETSGELTAPSSKVKVRERARPASVDAAHTFSVSEILNAPQFVTDIENMVSTAIAQGPYTSATATDTSLTDYVGSASDSTEVLFRDSVDLLGWAQDRLLRGKATGVRLPSFSVDALQINRWSDVSAIRAGDRVRVTLGAASTQLGVSYVDGWVVGGSYDLSYPNVDHEDDEMVFTFTMQPVLAAPGVYDTAVYDTATYGF